MENTRLFKIIIIVWRTRDIKVFSSTTAEGSGGGLPGVTGGGWSLDLIFSTLSGWGFGIAGDPAPL